MKPLLLLLALGVATVAAAQESRPRTRVTSCTSSGCHASELDHKFLHGPTAISACDACHEYVDPVQHTFDLKRQGKDLCIFCHIDTTGTEGPFVHAPVSDGQCLACHNPHGGDSRRLLRSDSVNGVCFQCHAQVMAGSHAHRPAAEDCTACHEPHTAQHARLLRVPGEQLCATCHDDVLKSVSAMAHPHKPAQGDCLTCHSPHATDSVSILKQSPRDLCLSCHAEVGRTISAATHPHSVTTDERACLNCHAAHASDHASMLLKDTVATCLECHKKPIVVSETRKIAGVPELAAPKFFTHGPIQQGECSACHDVHGGSLANLLVEPYPASFYLTYTEDAYALCFKCHDRALIESTDDQVQTRFRDGNRNLHAVHVASSAQGRSCRACHAVHASRFKSLLADSVTFGQWKLPINYTPTPTGGSCAPGCHAPESYSRGGPSADALVEPQPDAPEPAPDPDAPPAAAPEQTPPPQEPAPAPGP